ncbi:uncharacterized protein METZ01_LOCUS444856 [marine metagenome]|uniref:Uncharacterized protein n=1 Tax=marine metagenome TaxID=408172 RepID=A0A382Z935_9ZZZZ
MPIPKRKDNEPKEKFMSRCMGDGVMKKEYPDQSQRAAVCMSKAMNLSVIEAVDLQLKLNADERAGYPPNCNKGYVEKDGKCVPVEEGGAHTKKLGCTDPLPDAGEKDN